MQAWMTEQTITKELLNSNLFRTLLKITETAVVATSPYIEYKLYFQWYELILLWVHHSFRYAFKKCK